MKFRQTPEKAIQGAVNAGFDADSVACMAGQLVGVWWGARHLKKTLKGWWEGLEGREALLSLADQLSLLAHHQLAPAPPPSELPPLNPLSLELE